MYTQPVTGLSPSSNQLSSSWVQDIVIPERRLIYPLATSIRGLAYPTLDFTDRFLATLARAIGMDGTAVGPVGTLLSFLPC